MLKTDMDLSCMFLNSTGLEPIRDSNTEILVSVCVCAHTCIHAFITCTTHKAQTVVCEQWRWLQSSNISQGFELSSLISMIIYFY